MSSQYEPVPYDEFAFLNYIKSNFDIGENFVSQQTLYNGKDIKIDFSYVMEWEEEHFNGKIYENGEVVGTLRLSRVRDEEMEKDVTNISLSAWISKEMKNFSNSWDFDTIAKYIAIFFPLPEDIKEPSE